MHMRHPTGIRLDDAFWHEYKSQLEGAHYRIHKVEGWSHVTTIKEKKEATNRLKVKIDTKYS